MRIVKPDAKSIAALIAWLDSKCPHGYKGKSMTVIFTKRMCPRCWQEFKQSSEVKQ